MTRRARYTLDVAAIAAAYLALARLGLFLTLPGTNVSFVWLPAGVALAALWIFGTSRWPAIAIGELTLMLSLGYRLDVGLVAGTANAIQALVGVYLLRHVVHLDRAMERLRDVIGVAVTALVSAALGATIAVTGFGVIGRFPWQSFAGVWRGWWLGDVIGIILLTPALMTWWARPGFSVRPSRIAEAVALGTSLAAVSFVVFAKDMTTLGRVPTFATFPLLTWAALRFQQRGATTALLLVSAFAIWGTAHGVGSLARPTAMQSLFNLDAYLMVAALTTMLLAAVVAERVGMTVTLRASEARAKEERERFRALVELGSDIIAMTDKYSVVTYISPSVTRVLGYTPEELIGQPGLAFVHPDDSAPAKAHLEAVLHQPGATRAETLRARHTDGTWRYLEVVTANRLDEPSVGALVSNFRDLTDRRRLEEQLLASQRMEAVGRLAGGVAHDFNNILTAILGHAELLREVVEAEGPAAEELQEIRVAATRATMLTQQLLAFSRKQILQPKVLDVNALMSDLEKMLRRLIGEDVALETRFDPAVDRIRADRSQLERAIVNLVLNARDAMPEGGRVTLATANEELAIETATTETPARGPGRYVMLAVTDTGVGMDADVQAHLFEPFYTTKERGKGTGLGLATVYGMVRQSGGHVTVESAPGKGSTFRVYLPAVQAAVEVTPSHGVAPLHRGSETILLVEDDPSVRSVARRVLTRFGYTVIEAVDGASALQQAREHVGRIHLLLTDIIMPGMNGRRVAEEVGFVRPDLKLLFMSGYTDDAIVHHGVVDAGIPFLQKPFTVDELAGKVREVLDA